MYICVFYVHEYVCVSMCFLCACTSIQMYLLSCPM